MTLVPDDPIDLLARVVREHRMDLAGVARREGLRPEDALDCVHDAYCTFLELAVRNTLPSNRAEYAPFLTGIVVNTARNKRRRHHLARHHEAIDGMPLDADLPSTETQLALAEDCVRLRACMQKLCETHRTVVMMRLLEERAGEDVATALGLTRGHIDVVLHRAKAALRVCMMGEDADVSEPPSRTSR